MAIAVIKTLDQAPVKLVKIPTNYLNIINQSLGLSTITELSGNSYFGYNAGYNASIASSNPTAGITNFCTAAWATCIYGRAISICNKKTNSPNGSYYIVEVDGVPIRVSTEDSKSYWQNIEYVMDKEGQQDIAIGLPAGKHDIRVITPCSETHSTNVEITALMLDAAFYSEKGSIGYTSSGTLTNVDANVPFNDMGTAIGAANKVKAIKSIKYTNNDLTSPHTVIIKISNATAMQVLARIVLAAGATHTEYFSPDGWPPIGPVDFMKHSTDTNGVVTFTADLKIPE